MLNEKLGSFSSDTIRNCISRDIKMRIRNIFIMILVLGYLAIKLYIEGGRTIDAVFIVTMTLGVLIIGGIQYAQISSPGKTVVKTAVAIEVSTDVIEIITSPYQILFFIDKPSQSITMRTNRARVKAINYPVKSIYDLDFRAYLLFDGTEEVYVITDYFETKLSDLLIGKNYTV
ncbi:hypothetical protein [Mucilaginibacter sp. OK283]|uniref:hypothetical protein n=1 Tax=Mucilaginibacter sp. OK283 TaxID=1881049 RepID=UPI0008CB98DA|nr:hypothetical protein [Mucilaginibacter sp. OK283]SEO98507.1 hypothetical protein SAMN05428947_105345 [Mucilaginibacter sp. OK283]